MALIWRDGAWSKAMTDLRERLERLRAEAKSCDLMSKSATDPVKRELFGRLAEQLAIEVLELEQVVKKQTER